MGAAKMSKEIDILKRKRLEKISTLELRGKYQELSAGYLESQKEIERLERLIERQKEKSDSSLREQEEKYEKILARIRAGRDRRLGKWSFKVFRRERQIFRLKQVLQNKLPARKKVKVRKRELTKEAREQGYKKGLQRNIQVKRKDAYRQGWKEGYNAGRTRAEKERGGMIYRSGSVDSIAKCALMVQKLWDALNLPPEYISIMLLAGQYEAFLFEDLKSSFEQIEGDLFYRRIFYLKNKGYAHRIGTRNGRVIWALTPLGKEVHKRMTAYIGRNLKTK